MLLVVPTDHNTVEVNFMWLPSWLSFNKSTMDRLNKVVAEYLVGKSMTEEYLKAAHDLVVKEIATMHPHFKGIDDYLDALKFVRLS